MSQIPDKGMFKWRTRNVFGGDPKKIAESLNDAQIKRFDVKVAEAQNIYFHWWGASRVENVTPEWLEEFRQYFEGEVYGWGFCYGYDYKGEGRRGGEQVKRLNLDGYAFNAEATFERQPSAAIRASDLMAEFRKIAPDTKALWLSWPLWYNPYPDGNKATWHYHEVARNAMIYCNFGMPMIYWPNSGAYWAKFWLEKAIEQWRELVTDKPLIPVGRLYTGDGGVCSAEAITAFGEDVRKKYGLFGESWWRMGTGLAKADWWTAMKRLAPFSVEPPPNIVPVPVWRNEITIWARKMGYDGPWPEQEPVGNDG